MSAPKFTPGPWWALKSGNSADWSIRSNGKVYTRGYAVGVAYGDTSGHDIETRANAHLIAAAPDLYEALETMMAHVEGRAGYSTAHHKARAALATARGETP